MNRIQAEQSQRNALYREFEAARARAMRHLSPHRAADIAKVGMLTYCLRDLSYALFRPMEPFPAFNASALQLATDDVVAHLWQSTTNSWAHTDSTGTRSGAHRPTLGPRFAI